MLPCLLKWLGGGSYPHMRQCAGISPATFYSPVFYMMLVLPILATCYGPVLYLILVLPILR